MSLRRIDSILLALALPCSITLTACTDPGARALEVGDDESSDSSTSTTTTTTTTTDPETDTDTDTETETDTDTDDPETGPEPSCPEPSVAPELVDDPAIHCSPGFSFDASYRLCVSETEAIGPFPPVMVDACIECGGVDCEAATWPADQARGLRGTTPCWPGTTALESICVDDEHAWGPFSPTMVAGCKDAGGGEVTCESMRWARELGENLLPSALGQDWVWLMPIDVGLRDDNGGGGAFSAPRFNNPGGHSGIDVLAPVGTPLLAPCSGRVLVGFDGGYGNYVQLACEIPPIIAGGEALWGSLLFAHLDSTAVSTDEIVETGQQIGTVGKSGNAAAPVINAHVHFEIAIHASEAAALAETHASANHAGNAAGDLFAPRFASECLDVLEFDSTTGPTMKGRRPDPFMLMACLSANKPALTEPDPGLQSVPTPWSDHYEAVAFDVDVGL